MAMVWIRGHSFRSVARTKKKFEDVASTILSRNHFVIPTAKCKPPSATNLIQQDMDNFVFFLETVRAYHSRKNIRVLLLRGHLIGDIYIHEILQVLKNSQLALLKSCGSIRQWRQYPFQEPQIMAAAYLPNKTKQRKKSFSRVQTLFHS